MMVFVNSVYVFMIVVTVLARAEEELPKPPGPDERCSCGWSRGCCTHLLRAFLACCLRCQCGDHKTRGPLTSHATASGVNEVGDSGANESGSARSVDSNAAVPTGLGSNETGGALGTGLRLEEQRTTTGIISTTLSNTSASSYLGNANADRGTIGIPGSPSRNTQRDGAGLIAYKSTQSTSMTKSVSARRQPKQTASNSSLNRQQFIHGSTSSSTV
jgi:hypothetical protein